MIQIHGHQIEGDPEGLRYMESLNEAEARTLFDEAKMRGKSAFKYNQKNYEVVHTTTGTYVVSRFGSPSSSIF